MEIGHFLMLIMAEGSASGAKLNRSEGGKISGPDRKWPACTHSIICPRALLISINWKNKVGPPSLVHITLYRCLPRWYWHLTALYSVGTGRRTKGVRVLHYLYGSPQWKQGTDERGGWVGGFFFFLTELEIRQEKKNNQLTIKTNTFFWKHI